jgi:uncharacterized damage-inducible protein DinB
MVKQNLLLMAEYNIWATERLAQTLSTVRNHDFHQEIGLYFKSLIGTLNHLLLGEHYIWYRRFVEGVSPRHELSEIVEPHPQLCIQQLLEKSHHWIEFIHHLSDEQLQGDLHYHRANGEALSLPFTATLMHVFNHGTHHRGQISAGLTMLGYTCPELDLVYMLAE